MNAQEVVLLLLFLYVAVVDTIFIGIVDFLCRHRRVSVSRHRLLTPKRSHILSLQYDINTLYRPSFPRTADYDNRFKKVYTLQISCIPWETRHSSDQTRLNVHEGWRTRFGSTLQRSEVCILINCKNFVQRDISIPRGVWLIKRTLHSKSSGISHLQTYMDAPTQNRRLKNVLGCVLCCSSA